MIYILYLKQSQFKVRSIQFSRFVSNRFPESLIPRLSNICPVLSFLREFRLCFIREIPLWGFLLLACCHFLALRSISLSFFCTTDLTFVCPRQLLYVHCYSQHKLKQESGSFKLWLTIAFSSKTLANLVSFFNFFCLWSLETVKTEVSIKIIYCRKLFKSFMCVLNLRLCSFHQVIWQSVDFCMYQIGIVSFLRNRGRGI